MSLEIRDLCKKYKDFTALHSLSFTLPPGTATALLGPNGAGKSSAVKTMVTLLPPDGGQFLYQDRDLFQNPAEIRNLLGYVSQEMAMDKQMTGAEFMRFCAGIMHLKWKDHRDRAMDLLDRMGLTEAKDKLVGEYSGGMKRRLDLASSLLNDPKILILDEPTTGLDIEARETIWRLLKAFMQDGGSIILASHDFREVEELSDAVVILNKGKTAASGTPDDLKAGLGDLMIRLKTKQFMTREEIQAVEALFQSWGDAVTPKQEEEQVTLVYKGDEPINAVQNKVFETLSQAKREVLALNVAKPDLEDVYRFTVGGDAQ